MPRNAKIIKQGYFEKSPVYTAIVFFAQIDELEPGEMRIFGIYQTGEPIPVRIRADVSDRTHPATPHHVLTVFDDGREYHLIEFILKEK